MDFVAYYLFGDLSRDHRTKTGLLENVSNLVFPGFEVRARGLKCRNNGVNPMSFQHIFRAFRKCLKLLEILAFSAVGAVASRFGAVQVWKFGDPFGDLLRGKIFVEISHCVPHRSAGFARVEI